MLLERMKIRENHIHDLKKGTLQSINVSSQSKKMESINQSIGRSLFSVSPPDEEAMKKRKTTTGKLATIVTDINEPIRN